MSYEATPRRCHRHRQRRPRRLRSGCQPDAAGEQPGRLEGADHLAQHGAKPQTQSDRDADPAADANARTEPDTDGEADADADADGEADLHTVGFILGEGASDIQAASTSSSPSPPEGPGRTPGPSGVGSLRSEP